MKVIKPSSADATTIVSSTLTEVNQEWSNTTSYTAGAIVCDGLLGIYQAITPNTGKKPSENPLDWQYIQPSNRFAFLDSQISTTSTADQLIEIKLATGALQGLALLNLQGNLVEVTITDGETGPVIYNGVQSLLGDIFDWYQYFFFELETRKNQAIFIDLPLNYINTFTTIKLTGPNQVSIGTCTFGKILEIGSSEYGFTSGITDYSVKQTDEFGQVTFVRRAYSKRMSGRVLINNADLNRVQRTLYDLRAVPALWFASQNPTLQEALVVFGYYKDFSTDISYPKYSYCSLDIEGLI
jgi:hypothetical protein